jgi:hypothetical protein
VQTGDDQPFHIGYIEPAAGFATVASLFREMATIYSVQTKESKERWNELRHEILRPGLCMIGESTGQLRFEPLIITPTGADGTKISWRGYVWHNGQRL